DPGVLRDRRSGAAAPRPRGLRSMRAARAPGPRRGGTARSKVPPSPGMRVIHAADLHIDSPLRGLGRIEGAPVDDIRLATRKAFTRLVDTCLEDQAALLVLAGDVFDGEWRDFNTGLFFVRELARLRDVGTQVVMVRGNHDAESVLARHIPLPDHVYTFPVEAPATLELPALGLAVHGQSYGSR